MIPHYRSNNKEILKELHDHVFKHDRSPQDVWNIFKRYIYLDDLFTYALAIFTPKEPERGVGNLNSKIMIVVNTMKDKDLMELFKKVFRGIHMDYNSVYFTSYNKISKGDPDRLEFILQAEIKNIRPSILLQVGDYGLESTETMSVITVLPAIMTDIIRLNRIEDKEGASMDTNLKKELNTNKKVLWDSIKPIIKYYE